MGSTLEAQKKKAPQDRKIAKRKGRKRSKVDSTNWNTLGQGGDTTDFSSLAAETGLPEYILDKLPTDPSYDILRRNDGGMARKTRVF